ncbi:gamma-glutamyltransferase [Paenibacillus sp. J2TS4]|uniref:gamma-glutamyltransferase n=1 Tax=Paenibacillus sp. J2TS4 TaxID=2807194 RepID=UPI001B192005|nr:gamma-glutamyltransferase [Paenibacillus sp. J2TS4]GIP33437.1 hypothetical protein J2TS4_26470 [Paenibacillus sp. J2TS4]
MFRARGKSLSCAVLAFFMLLAAPATAFPDRLPWYDQNWQAEGTGGAAATEHPLASQAAMEILSKGGNAVEAAIAASAVLGVVRPFSGGIGGGGYMHIYLKEEDRFIVLDHRETAQGTFGPHSFMDENGDEYDSETRYASGMAVGVPGTVKAWEEALNLYGTGMTLSELLQPAIEVAENGFYADENLIREISENTLRFSSYQSTADLYLNSDGSIPSVGTLMTNPDLAATYRLIADQGSHVFYNGEIAQAIVDTVNAPPAVDQPVVTVLPGDMSLSDLHNYNTLTYSPVKVDYHGYEVYGPPPSASGGTTIGQALNILEGYNLKGLPRSEALHYYIEASRYAFADRDAYLGDPATYHGPLPVTGLLSKGYAESIRQQIEQTGTGYILEPGNPWPYNEDPELWPDPLPSAGKNRLTVSFAGLADGASWDSSGKFWTATGIGSNRPDEGAIIDVQDGTGRIELTGTKYAYARAESDMEEVYDSELLIRFKMNELGDDRNLRFWLRADHWNSTTAPSNGYGIEVNTGSDSIRIIRTRDGNGVYGLAEFDYNRTTDWQWLRFRVEGDQLKIRLWKDGESEPRNTWTHTLQNSQVSGIGKFLLSALELTGDGQGGSFQIGDVYVTELNPLAFGFQFDGLADGASWDSSGKFITATGTGSSKPGEGAVIDVRNGIGNIELTGAKNAYARAEPQMEAVYDSELLVRFKMNELGDDRNLRFWLRADGWNSTTAPHNGYGLEINTKTDTVRILRTRNSNGIYGLATVDHPRTTEWQWLRFRVEGGGIKVRIWKDGEEEPAGWLHQRTNNDVVTPGKLLLSAIELTGGAGASGGSFQIDKLKVYDLDSLNVRESTIHHTVSDQDGNIVAYTNTLNAIGGNGMVVPGYGFLLNNGLTSRTASSVPAGHPNAPRAGMRTLSSMSPIIIMKDGEPVLAVGSPGGTTIITTVLQVIINYLDFDMSLPEAVTAPRVSQRNHSSSGKTLVEAEFENTPEFGQLHLYGQEFNISGLSYGIGAVNAIAFFPDGHVQAVSEQVRRGGGSAMVENESLAPSGH